MGSRKTKKAGSKGSRSRKRAEKRRQRRIKRRLTNLACLAIIFLFVYQLVVSNVSRTVDRAMASIINSDYQAQEENFERVKDINDILKESFSDDPNLQEEFLMAYYKNLTYEIVAKEKTEDGLEVSLRLKNLDYVEVFDEVSAKEGEEMDRDFIKALEAGEGKAYTTEGKLLLVRKFSGYDIYESRDFINGILGGALRHSKIKDLE